MNPRLVSRRIAAVRVSTVFEVGFTLLSMHLLSGAPLWSSGAPAAPIDDAVRDVGNPITYAISASTYIVPLVLIARRPKALRRALSADLLLVAILAMTVASAIWSDEPNVAFRRAIALVGTSIFGLYLHLRYSLEQQLRLVAWTLALGAILSLSLASPSAVLAGGFSGIYETKNSLGRIMALSGLISVLLASTGRGRVPAYILGALSLLLVLLANSMTGFVVLMTILCLIPLLRMLARDMRLAVGLGSIAILLLGCGALVAASNLEAVTAVVGRDATLTGRTALWQAVIEMILRRPWLGYGYETFWLYDLPWRFVVDQSAGWTAPNAHNGFLEVALALGISGLLVFLAGLLRGLIRAVRYLQLERSPLGLWPLVYLAFIVLYNVTEIAALTRNTIVWALYVSTLLAVSTAGRGTSSATVTRRARSASRLRSYAVAGDRGDGEL